jgi:hypothetical protein
MPPAIQSKITVSAVDAIFETDGEQELKKLAIGRVMADAAKLAAVILFMKSLREFCACILFWYLID